MHFEVENIILMAAARRLLLACVPSMYYCLKVERTILTFLWKNSFNFCVFVLQGATDFLLKGVQFTKTSAEYMMSGTPVGEAFK